MTAHEKNGGNQDQDAAAASPVPEKPTKPKAKPRPRPKAETTAWLTREPKSWKQPFLEHLAMVPNVAAACRTAQISRKSAYLEKDLDPEFAEAWDDAIKTATDRIERIAHNWATSGIPVKEIRTKVKRDSAGNVVETERTETEHVERSVAMLIFLLKCWRPEVYKERLRVEQTGAGGGPIRYEFTQEEVDAAVGRFDAEVVRLSDRRRARESAQGGGGTG